MLQLVERTRDGVSCSTFVKLVYSLSSIELCILICHFVYDLSEIKVIVCLSVCLETTFAVLAVELHTVQLLSRGALGQAFQSMCQRPR